MAQRLYDVELLLKYPKEWRKKVYKQLRTVANKRLARLKESGLYEESIAYKYGIDRFGTEYSEKDYLKLLNFINRKTSTVSGVRKKKKDMDKLGERFGLGQGKGWLLERFLHSNEYKMLNFKYPSEDVIEAFAFLASMYDSYETIMRYIEDYITMGKASRKKKGKRII